MPRSVTMSQQFYAWLSDNPDQHVLRWIFRGIVSVTDALAMGRLIRDKKFATEIEAGKYCASSCPLVFAGGVERRAGDRAAIGVHQVAAIGPGKGLPRDEMDVAQRISARCQRYLG